MKYIYYKTDGTKEDIFVDKPLSLETLNHLVAGYIEGIRLRNGHYLFINEEGLLLHLPENPHFTEADIYVDLSHSGGRLLGNVIEGKVTEEGEFVGVDL